MQTRIDNLLSKLDKETIKKIDQDPLLCKDKRGNLTIANASKALFTPQEEHQLLAKGIVYDSDYNLVSLPLVKIYNFGENQISDKWAKKLNVTEIPKKYDGTMIQIFSYQGETIYTTRSRFFADNYCDWAQEIMAEKYPSFKPEEGLSYVFELIHPENRIITDYGDLRDMILLSVFDGEKYLKLSNIRAKYGDQLTVVDNLLEGLSCSEIKKVVSQFNDTTEGVVAVFEDDEQVLHRVKIKSTFYVELHRLKFGCTYKAAKEVLLSNPHLQSWDKFIEYNREINMFAEELEGFLQEYFDRFMLWKSKTDTIYHSALEEAEVFKSNWKPDWIEDWPGVEWEVDINEMCRDYSKVKDSNPLVFPALRGNLTWEKVSKNIED